MCGVAGFVGGQWPGAERAAQILERMNACLRHRGPDASNIWVDSEAEVGFAHNRLAIIDLSPAGDQPTLSASGRYVIVYNGEVYNHEALREELAATGHAIEWRGHSDTETLLTCIEAWGMRRAVERATGMFAIALWDKAERTLTLARDRLGEKPLYYARARDGAFLFGSELKALADYPAFNPEVDRDALALLLRYGNVPAPFAITRDAHKLPPASILTLGRAGEPLIEPYWSATTIAEAGVADPTRAAPEEVVDELERLLDRSVRGQMIADVPLGAFLSGGIDSSTIVATMQKLSARPVKTFTIGFDEPGYDEAPHARAVAQHLGTDHHQLYVTAQQARDVIPTLPRMFDEPFADSSQIPTHLVAALARSEVTVALSGDGGDELFGGYNRYVMTSRLWSRLERVPAPVRGMAAAASAALPLSAWDAVERLPGLTKMNRLGEKMHKGAALLRSRSANDLYRGMCSLWRDPAAVVLDGREPPTEEPSLPGLSTVERMMALDLVGYLPDDILVKVDRAAMAVSLETRVPFLDHQLVEFAWRIPLDLKIRDGEGKWLLRRLLERHVPRALFERPKMGFGVPVGAWLRGPLRDWAEALLSEQRLREEGYFRPEPIRRVWAAHLRGRVNDQERLWPVLMFQNWLEARAGAA